MGALTLVPLPLTLTDHQRSVDRITARAIHLTLWSRDDDAVREQLVACEDADLQTLVLAAARMEHALADEHSTVIERAARNLRAAARQAGER